MRRSLETTIELLRHGATARRGFLGSLDEPLTLHGLEQMRAAVRDGGPWDVAVSSPLARCAAFAREFAERQGIALHFDERLRELHFGEWEGMSAEQLMQTRPDALTRFWDDPWRHAPPGGETLGAFEERVLTAWRDLVRRYARHGVLVIAHGGVIRMILCHVRGLSRTALLRIEVRHASLHRVTARCSPPIATNIE